MDLDKKTFFIYNKVYEYARLAQWGNGGREVGTHEHIYPDQLWILERCPVSAGCYYYISNAVRQGFRLAKWGAGDDQTGVYNGQYEEDQLWRFQQEGNYYRIYNKKYSDAKIAKWGKGDNDWGSYAGPDYDDQLWKLVPRFNKAEAREYEIWSCNNRLGTRDVVGELNVTTGVKLARSLSLTTKIGFESSLYSSLSAGIDCMSAGLESSSALSAQIKSNISGPDEKWWSTQSIRKYIAPAGKKYRVLQTTVLFTSPLESDNCSLYCKERIEETA